VRLAVARQDVELVNINRRFASTEVEEDEREDDGLSDIQEQVSLDTA